MVKRLLPQSVVAQLLGYRLTMIADLAGRLEKEVQKNLNNFIDRQAFIPPRRKKQLKKAVARLRSQEIADKARKTRAELLKRMETTIGKTLSAFDIATKKELKDLGKRLEAISSDLQALKGKSS